MRMGHVGRTGLLLLVAVALAAAGCRRDEGAAGAAAGPPVEGGTVVVGVRTDFGPFNSIVNTDLITDELIKYALFTPLVQYDEDLNVRPYLAESWDLEGDTAVVFASAATLARGHAHRGDVAPSAWRRTPRPRRSSRRVPSEVESATIPPVHDPSTVRCTRRRSRSWCADAEAPARGVPPASSGRRLSTAPQSGAARTVSSSGARTSGSSSSGPTFPEALAGRRSDRIVFRVISRRRRCSPSATGGVHVDIRSRRPGEPDRESHPSSSPTLADILLHR